jgi:hypothetical protein
MYLSMAFSGEEVQSAAASLPDFQRLSTIAPYLAPGVLN